MGSLKHASLVVASVLAASISLPAASHGRVATSMTANSNAGYAKPEGRELLKQIAEDASAIRGKIGSLDIQTRFNEADFWIQSSALNEVRDDVNAMGKDLRRLTDLRSQLDPSQQREVDRITPLAVALADSTKDAIHVFNQKHGQTWTTHLPDDLSTMSNEAQEIRSSVDESLKLAKLIQEIGRLGQKS